MRDCITQLNNEGFSLVELIVTVLIIAIISTSSVLAVSIVYNSDVERAGKVLVSAVNEGRQKNITVGDSENTASVNKTEVFTAIYVDDKGYFVAETYSKVLTTTPAAVYSDPTSYGVKQLGKYKMTMEFGVNKTNGLTKVDPAPDFEAKDKVVFAYDKSSGGIKRTFVEKADGSTTDYNITDVIISGSKTVNLVIVRETGRCYICD